MGCYVDIASYVLVDMIYSIVIRKDVHLNLVSMCVRADTLYPSAQMCVQVVWLYRLNCCLKDQRHCVRFTVAYEVSVKQTNKTCVSEFL